MSMVLSRSPLEPIGMNATAAAAPKRRSARLSGEGAEENEPPAKKTKVNGVQTSTVSTKEQDGDAGAASKKKRKVYEEDDDGFSYSKSRKSRVSKAPTVRNSTAERLSPAAKTAPMPQPQQPIAPAEEAAPKTAAKKVRRKLPTTPERDAAAKPLRRSKRPSTETVAAQHASPHKAAHAKSHANQERSPSPLLARPVTIEKKRRHGEGGVEEEQKTMRIQLPWADTPVIKRNKEMRKTSAENGQRRSSLGIRGKRASSLIDEGRGNALPHPEVPAAEFFKHIGADLTEPRRMRCLLGWCGTRALPPKPDAPKDHTPASNLEFQALQAARVIQEELAHDLITKGLLSDWFSRDESAPPKVPLGKKPNPRNIANAAKAEELERELARLKMERAGWSEAITSAAATMASPSHQDPDPERHQLSPLHPELLDSPQRAILEQLHAPTTAPLSSTEPNAIAQRLRHISENLEFTVDQFAHEIHALAATRDTADRLADQTLGDAAKVLEEREKEMRLRGKAADPMDALRGLAKVLNSQQR